MDYSLIKAPWWNDRPLLLIGGGPSLNIWDNTDLRDRGRVVLINDSVRYAKGDVLFSGDANWHRRSFEEISAFKGEEIIITVVDEVKKHPGPTKTPVTYVVRKGGKGFSADPGYLYNFGHSGYGAFNCAILKRAKLIYLLGYDMNVGHHEQWHPSEVDLDLPKRRHNPGYYSGWAETFNTLSKRIPSDVKVINLNRYSAITAFQKGTYQDIGMKLRRKNIEQV